MSRSVSIVAALLLVHTNASLGQHQTETFSPVITDAVLPYEVELIPYDLGATALPSLHSFVSAQWDGKWMLIGGRTNGLHAFTQNGFANFPIAFQNREVWVIDPVNGESWHRSWDDETSGLSTSQIDSLSAANHQAYQADDRLYVSGGYGYQTDFDFVTFDRLTAIDVPGLMNWVQGADGTAAEQVRQLHDPLFAVTGGAMHAMGGRTHLVFGQDFQGEYTPFGNGVYTNQVRSFAIIDDEPELSIQNVARSEQDDSYRRRDLNVVPVIRSDDGGNLVEELQVLSGVFTPEGGAWTVPVTVHSDGVPSMPNPEDPNTFKQAMNTYHSAKVGLFSEATDEMHMLLFGGISLNYYDDGSQSIVRDDFLPFINQATSVVIDRDNNYTQHLLPQAFPMVVDEVSGNRLLFGTNAEFMVSGEIPTYDNGVIRLDDIEETTLLGYIFGGIAADQPNQGNSAASGRIFQVLYTPVGPTAGDFDSNGIVNAHDVDLLAQELRLERDPADLRFDLDRSLRLDGNDLRFLIEVVLGTSYGDANLDGEFNSADLVMVFQAGQFEDAFPNNSRWETGDWDGDGEFGTSDFVTAFQAGGYENGPTALAVPEPASLVGTLWFVVLSVSCRCKCRPRSLRGADGAMYILNKQDDLV